MTLVIVLLLYIVKTQYDWQADRERERLRLGSAEKPKGYIYFWRDAEDPRYIKIGRAKKWTQRIKTFQTAQPRAILVLGVVGVRNDVEAERYVHLIWSHLRVKNEWFYSTHQLRRYINLVRDLQDYQQILDNDPELKYTKRKIKKEVKT